MYPADLRYSVLQPWKNSSSKDQVMVVYTNHYYDPAMQFCGRFMQQCDPSHHRSPSLKAWKYAEDIYHPISDTAS